MFKLIKDGELRFPERPEVSKEAKDFITKVRYYIDYYLRFLIMNI